MKTTSYTTEGKALRLVLRGMVYDRGFLSEMEKVWTKQLFDTDHVNLIADWCVSYYRKFNKQPNDNITVAFLKWAEKGRKDEKLVSAVEKLLLSISEDYKHDPPIDAGYTQLIAEELIEKINANRMNSQVEQLLDNGRVKEASALISQYREFTFETNEREMHPCEEDEPWALIDNPLEIQRPLVKYKGALAEFFRGSLRKKEFYSFMGPDKTGKTTDLVDFVVRALKAKNNVAFIDTGDGSREDFMDRLARRVSLQPRVDKKLWIPEGWDKDGSLKTKQVDKSGLNVWQTKSKFAKMVCNGINRLKVDCFPNSSCTVQHIDGLLEKWSNEGWVCDVLVIDYADILAPPIGVKDVLEQIDENWKQLRKLSQKRNVLLMTATQSNSQAYRKGDKSSVLGPQHFSGRKTKLAHVNGMIGINVTPEERAGQSSRWNWVVRRKQDHQRPKVVHLAGNYDIENPCIVSRW